jgi:CTP-dependent riboflavin kinase
LNFLLAFERFATDVAMRVFTGIVTTGYGMAARNLDPVMSLIEERTGLLHLARGTLNVTIPEEYIVRPDALVLPEEYPFNKESGLHETIKFQRCLVAGYRGLIMRPDSHELGAGQFHGKAYLELMGQKNFREALSLTNGSTVDVQVEGDDVWWYSGM